jgi:hypothetical protein
MPKGIYSYTRLVDESFSMPRLFTRSLGAKGGAFQEATCWMPST